MSGRSTLRLIAVREIKQRLKSRAFFVFTAILCALIIGGGILKATLSGDDKPPSYTVAVVGSPSGQPVSDGLSAATGALADSFGVNVVLRTVTDRSTAERLLRSGDLDAAVDVASGELLSDRELPSALQQTVDIAWRSVEARRAAEAAGVTGPALDQLLTPAGLRAVQLQPSDDGRGIGSLVGTVSAVLLFISISSFGGYVLMGVVEEKTTGVVEVLLSKVRAHQLLAGKVVGIGAVALLQFTAAVAAGLVALKISGTAVPSAVWVGLPVTVLWFIGGFLLYSTLFALAGSFVSRQEDAQGAAAPISIVFMAAYLTVFTFGFVPQSTVSRVLSVLPPFAPLLMPLRMLTGAASVVEIALAAILLVAAICAMLRLAGAVYSRTLLHRGSRLRWKQALRLSKPKPGP